MTFVKVSHLKLSLFGITNLRGSIQGKENMGYNEPVILTQTSKVSTPM